MSEDSTARPLDDDEVVEQIDEAGANQPDDPHAPGAERRETGDVEQQKDALRETLERAAGDDA
jgi:hypothetical protein